MGKPEDISREAWDAAGNAYWICNPEGERAVSHETIARAIMAAKAEERERIRSAVVGHIMTVVESLMEGRMTDGGLTRKDHIEMQAQIEGLEVVAGEIQAMTFNVNNAHKISAEA